MKISLVCLFALGMAAGAARAQEPVKLLPGPFELPARLGPLVYNGEPHKFDQPQAGIAYNYFAEGMNLTVYVYDGGVPDIADGADTMPVCDQYEDSKRGLQQRPGLKNILLKSEYLVRLSPPDDTPLAREAFFEMESGDRKAISYVWLTAAAKHFVKLRFTMFAPHIDEAVEARRAVLDTVGSAIRPHLAPVDAEAKPKGTSLSIAFNDSGANDMGIGIGYLLVLSEMAEKNPANAPVCGGEYVPTFEEDVAAYQGALTIMEESGDGSRFAKKMAAANKAGMFEEFIWTELHREQWGTTPPDGLELAAYAPWRKKNVKKLQAPAFGGVTIDHPRPLPVEPSP